MMTTGQELAARDKRLLRLVCESYYDTQAVRIQTDHRIRNYAEAEGLAAVVGEIEFENLKRRGMADYKAAIRALYKEKNETFLAAFEKAVKDLEGDEKHAKVNWLMSQQEKVLVSIAKKKIAGHPVWENWLAGVKGIGPCLAGGLLSWINIARSTHCSQLWKYSGLGTTVEHYECPECGTKTDPKPMSELVAAGETRIVCPDCRVPLNVVGHADRRVKGQQTGYNPRVKTLAWKIGESFVKQSPEKSGYRKLYEQFRAQVDRQPCRKVHKDEKGKVIPCFDAHKFAKAKRMTVKVFMAHYYLVARTIEGLPVTKPYSFGVLAHDMASFIEPLRDEGEIPGWISAAWRQWL